LVTYQYGIVRIAGERQCEASGASQVNLSRQIGTQSSAVAKETDIKINSDIQATGCSVKVDVAGAVNLPGVYCLNQDATLADAVAKAGDFNKDVYAFKYISQRVNLAQKVITDQKIYMPFQDDVVCTEKANEFTGFQNLSGSNVSNISQVSDQNSTVKNPLDTGISSVCISLNNASIEELDTLVGVGISTATKIIEGRPYKQITDLMNVKGIGQATFDKLKVSICL
jgi:competence protein ComEA